MSPPAPLAAVIPPEPPAELAPPVPPTPLALVVAAVTVSWSTIVPSSTVEQPDNTNPQRGRTTNRRCRLTTNRRCRFTFCTFYVGLYQRIALMLRVAFARGTSTRRETKQEGGQPKKHRRRDRNKLISWTMTPARGGLCARFAHCYFALKFHNCAARDLLHEGVKKPTPTAGHRVRTRSLNGRCSAMTATLKRLTSFSRVPRVSLMRHGGAGKQVGRAHDPEVPALLGVPAGDT